MENRIAVMSDKYAYLLVTPLEASKIWKEGIFELYRLDLKNETEGLIEDMDTLVECLRRNCDIGIELGKIEESQGKDVDLETLQEVTLEATMDIMEIAQCSRYEALDIAKGWAEELTRNLKEAFIPIGSYYENVDNFIKKKIVEMTGKEPSRTHCINTRFSIGDTVWFLYNNAIQSEPVKAIHVVEDAIGGSVVQYSTPMGSLNEKNLFASKGELLKSLW
jgi:uncharacterized protein YlaN (UPF0358 family)